MFSFEFHEERHAKAAAEFEAHGLLSSVGGPIQLAHRNVIRDGFGDLCVKVDSVFLDLPAPWDALEDAKRIMNRSQISRICCFSPCIEQVQKTCRTLESLGFSDITMFEVLVRTHEPVSFETATIDDVVRRIKEVEMKKQLRRERQISEAKQRKQDSQRQSDRKPTLEEPNSKRNFGGTDSAEEPQLKKPRVEQEDIGEDPIAHDEHLPAKNGLKPSEGEMDVENSQDPFERNGLVTNGSTMVPSGLEDELSNARDKEGTGHPVKTKQAGKLCPKILQTSKPAGMSRGHTSFLTFAILLPVPCS